MKYFILIILLGMQIKLFSQNIQDNDTLRPIAIKIMNELNIPIRYFIHRDDPLKFNLYQSNSEAANYTDSSISVFFTKEGEPVFSERWCHKPVIYISSVLDSILNRTKNVSLKKFINAKATIIHELTHYLQQSYIKKEDYIDGTVNNWHAHTTQINEFEAYTVDSYYFLSIINNDLLNNIMNQNISAYERNKRIINAANQILYPNVPYLLLR